MRASLLLWLVAVAACAVALAAARPEREGWEMWHADATRRLAKCAGSGSSANAPSALPSLAGAQNHRLLADSLSLHVHARKLLHETDLPHALLRKFHKGLDAHSDVIDRALTELSTSAPSGGGKAGLMQLLKRAEASLARQYYSALRTGVIPPPRPKVGEMRAALLRSTGIDSTQDSDGQLFNIMVDHYDGKPPAAALGVSAKFFSNGSQQTRRYHVGLRLPCAAAVTDADRLAASSHKAASALSAPQIVHKWIDAVGDAPVGMGFGFARLDDREKRGGKIYVMNLAGTAIPMLPLSMGGESFSVTIFDVIPSLAPKTGSDLAKPTWLDSQMVSLEWEIGDDRVMLRHYVAERGSTHEQRIRAMGFPAEATLSALVANAGAKTETVKFTAPFRVVPDGVTSPSVLGNKVGLQLPDRSMTDASFLSVAGAALSAFNVPKEVVEKWLADSEGVTHTISNVQAAATESGSYITLYRHPLNVCFSSFSPSEDEMEARRRLRRGYEVSECDKAKLRLADSIWGDTYDAKNKAGTCANSHQPTGRCKECMEEFEGNGGAYVVKNKTACGAGVKSKELRGSTVKNCAEAVRQEASAGGFQGEFFLFGASTCTMVYLDLPATPVAKASFKDFPGFDRCYDAGWSGKCKSKGARDSECCSLPHQASCDTGWKYCKGVPGCLDSSNSPSYDKVSTCCVNATSQCPTQPDPPANWKYKAQAKIIDLCTEESSDVDLWRSPGTKDKEGTEMGKVGRALPAACVSVSSNMQQSFTHVSPSGISH